MKSSTRDLRSALHSKEVSWLHFNERVLNEAADATVPLLERLKFLGIYSNNLDEFFRVRVATLNRLSRVPRAKAHDLVGHDPGKTLKVVHGMVVNQQRKFDRVFRQILLELMRQGVIITNERRLTAAQARFVEGYFQQVVRTKLFPIMLDPGNGFPDLKDKSIYLAITLTPSARRGEKRHALIEVPADLLSRFVRLPQSGDKTAIIMLDDVIRHNLRSIFGPFGYVKFAAHTIKLTRDGELEIDNDIFESYVRKLHKSLKQRREGEPVRFVYDATIPEDLLKLITRRLSLGRRDPIIAGSRYHNFKDFVHFPDVGPRQLRYPKLIPAIHKGIAGKRSTLDAVVEADQLLHLPYQPFDHMIDLLREASLDRRVKSIKITLYRTAQNSSVVNALMNAVKNGKSVVAVVELQARFDEEANIRWATELQDAGAKVVFGVPGLKVHAKLCLVTRRKGDGTERIAVLGTGNFNEDTARVYTDDFLLTAHPGLTEQVADVFEFLERNYRIANFRHLLVAPFNMRKKLIRFIDLEMENALHGKEAWILAKLNHLTDPELMEALYKASEAGVDIRLIVRGMFTMSTGVPGPGKKIQAIRLVDKLLEHSRVVFFANGGQEKCFISSGDWMPRNLDGRVEVACPIWDPLLRSELKDMLELQWRDNVKSTTHVLGASDRARARRNGRPLRAQQEILNYLRSKHR